MWEIAEKGDTKSAQEFADMFPAHADEMRDRMRMVSGVKDMKTAVAPAFVPAFTPRYMPARSKKWMRFGPSALGIAALAAASFYVTQNVLTPLPDSKALLPTTHAT